MVYIVYDEDGYIQCVYKDEYKARGHAKGIGGTCEAFALN